MSERHEENGLKLPRWFWFGILPAVVILWLLLSFGPMVLYGFREPADAVSIANSLGGASSLFTGLAFAFLIVTIWLQRKELGFQREELRLQRLELAKSIEELKGQKQQMTVQNEQNFFFKLLEIYESNLLAVDFDGKKGEEAISALESRIRICMDERYMKDNRNVDKNSLKNQFAEDDEQEVTLRRCYVNGAMCTHELVRYQKSIKSILEFIDTRATYENTELFLDTFTGLLSTEEYLMIFYDAIFYQGVIPNHPVERFRLLYELDPLIIPLLLRDKLEEHKEVCRTITGFKLWNKKADH